jgi:outer membrane protein OmpA-like peptidoglycan-associated protein
MLRPLLPMLLLGASACVAPLQLAQRLEATEDVLDKARKLNADKCAPVMYANAKVDAEFARMEFRQGNPRRAVAHTEAAEKTAAAALQASEACGGRDADGDGIPDVLDRCPNEPEDRDGDRDEDGCRDLDPYGDLDGDGIRNIDDSCVEEAEDFDGHNDGDGCPETSEDRDGDSIIDALDKCPAEAEDLDGFKDGDGCPELDNDGDQIPDVRDACPNASEDVDDWEDGDGCPDDDNDDDGIADVDDQCPNDVGDREAQGCPLDDADKDGVSDANDECPDEPETRNGYRDDDGCPDESNQRIRLTKNQIELVEPITFTGGTASLTPEALGVLADVTKTLEDVTDLRIRIEAHTDSRGLESDLLELSKRQANAVKQYLIDRGIDRRRLESEGYGPSQPIDTNRTERGRSANRRVELKIID